MSKAHFQLVLISIVMDALNVALVACHYHYNAPKTSFSVGKQRFATSTENWSPVGNGELSCSLTVRRKSPNVCRLSFNLDRSGNLDCRNEYLTIGHERICGRLPERYQLPYADEVIMTYRGRSPLAIEVEQVNCGLQEGGNCNLISRDLKIDVTSPNYPHQYPPLSNCQYTILPANKAVCQVSIFFHDFAVENSPGCHKDRLQVGGEFFCGELTGRRIDRNITTGLVIRFVSDSSISDRGFKATIEQIYCGNTRNNFQSTGEPCCRSDYSEQYAILKSPGFLDGQWVNSDCVHTIQPYSPGVSRVRFIFKHFWVGEEDPFYGCINGYLEIDGTRFCGCLDGYEYVSHFDQDLRKDLRYVHRGTGQRGFVIEVYQEDYGGYSFGRNATEVDPNTEIEIFGKSNASEKTVSRFLIPKDASRCYQWSLPGWQEQVRNFLANSPVSEFCESSTDESKRGFPNPLAPSAQFYPFPEDSFPPLPPTIPHFPPFTSIPPFPLQPEPFPVPFTPTRIKPTRTYRNCIVLDKIVGEFSSPYYPTGYPPNIRECYVFLRIPGYCSVEIKFIDFDLTSSIKCWKDYLLLERSARYCGQALRGKTVALYFRFNGVSFLDFHTDKFFAGRGFRGKYWQWPCPTPFNHLRRSELEAPAELKGNQTRKETKL